jgi:hypothetical protein
VVDIGVKPPLVKLEDVEDHEEVEGDEPLLDADVVPP